MVQRGKAASRLCRGQLSAGGIGPSSKRKHGQYPIPTSEAAAHAAFEAIEWEPALTQTDYPIAVEDFHIDGLRGGS